MTAEPNEQEQQRGQRSAILISAGILMIGALLAWGVRHYMKPKVKAVEQAPAESALAKVRKIKSSLSKVPPAHFVEVAAQVGVDWQHVSGANGKKYFPESMGTGVALFDWDNDGDADLVLNNATAFSEDSGVVEPGYVGAFENIGGGQFKDVSTEAGLKIQHYGTGVAVADYDGDGFRDLYLTAIGENRLFRNQGDGTFIDVTMTAGVAGDASDYSSCAAFFDADGDGDLDLLVGNYAVWDPELNAQVSTTVPGVGLVYNEPDDFEGQFARIYRNDGGGIFSELSEEWGVRIRDEKTGKPIGKNLGFALDYFNDDAVLDVVVPNDRVRNIFLTSKSDGGFSEEALERGLAYDRRGYPTAAMGVDIDFDPLSGERRIAMGNFFQEMTSMYVGTAEQSMFVDSTVSEGIGPRSNNKVTFGVVFVDYDNDGYRDVIEINGAIDDLPLDIQEGMVGIPYRQAGDIFWRCSGDCRTTYRYLGSVLSGAVGVPIVGRGLAVADIDNDGDLDLVASQISGPALVYRNESESGHSWLKIQVKGLTPNTDAYGAEILLRYGDRVQRRIIQPSHSYLSSSELVQTFGLGRYDGPVNVEVVWPGRQESSNQQIRELNRRYIISQAK